MLTMVMTINYSSLNATMHALHTTVANLGIVS